MKAKPRREIPPPAKLAWRLVSRGDRLDRLANKKRGAFSNSCRALRSSPQQCCGMKDLLDPPISDTAQSETAPAHNAASRSRRFNRILVPIDFSRPSLKAIPYALAISRQFGADVHLLHVTDVSSAAAANVADASRWCRKQNGTGDS